MVVDGEVDDVIGGDEQEDIDEQNVCEFHFHHENHHDVEGGERKGEGEDGHQGLVLGHARAHQFVVDVVLVGIEKGTAITKADKHHANNIKHRDDEHRD